MSDQESKSVHPIRDEIAQLVANAEAVPGGGGMSRLTHPDTPIYKQIAHIAPGDYIDFGRGEVILDGAFTAQELRELADVLDAQKVGGE